MLYNSFHESYPKPINRTHHDTFQNPFLPKTYNPPNDSPTTPPPPINPHYLVHTPRAGGSRLLMHCTPPSPLRATRDLHVTRERTPILARDRTIA